MKKRYFTGIILFYLLMNISVPRPISVQAARGARPTNINMSSLEGASLETYYSGISGKKGSNLLNTLHDIIKDHDEYDYDSTSDREIYKIIHRNWDLSPLSPAQLSNYNYSDNPYIIKLYADYNNNIATADTFKNPGASRVSFDKEHIWAQSMGNFGRRMGAGSDFHALWPADSKANTAAHSNYNYAVPTGSITNYTGDAGSPNWPQRTSGTYVGRNGTITGGSLKVFEPTDEWKGDIARAMLYMPVRYTEYIDTDHPKLQLVNGSPSAVTASPTQPGLAGDLTTLLAWNELDPPSDLEIRRNNLLYYNYQKNRNPFIDYPEWARIVYDTNYSGPGASFSDDDPAPERLLTGITLDTNSVKKTFNKGETFSAANLKVTASYDNGTSALVTFFTTNPAIGTPLNTVGEVEVNVSYTEGSQTFNKSYTITVNNISAAPLITDIVLNTDTVTKEFAQGDLFNIDGLKVTATYNDGASELLSSFRTNPEVGTKLNTLGEITVKVSYATGASYFEKTYAINVVKKVPSSETSTETNTNPPPQQNEPLQPVHIVLISVAGATVVSSAALSFLFMAKKSPRRLLKKAAKAARKSAKK